MKSAVTFAISFTVALWAGLAGLFLWEYRPLLTVGPVASARPTPAGLVDFYTATVKVRGARGEGSGVEGVFLGMEGVLTADHVVEDNQPLQIVDEDEDGTTTRSCKVVYRSARADLAFLTVTRSRARVSLAPVQDVKLGEDLWYASYGASTRKWLERSIVSRPYWKEKRCPDFAIEGFLTCGKGFYGSSGCGAFVKRGDRYVLAGICSRWASDDDGAFGFCPLAFVGPEEIEMFLMLAKCRCQ